MALSFQQWLQHGEMLYQAALQEFQSLEAQMNDLEQRLAAKQTELNHLVQMMSKPPVESKRNPSPLGAAPVSGDADRLVPPGAPNGRPLPGRVVRAPAGMPSGGNGTV